MVAWDDSDLSSLSVIMTARFCPAVQPVWSPLRWTVLAVPLAVTVPWRPNTHTHTQINCYYKTTEGLFACLFFETMPKKILKLLKPNLYKNCNKKGIWRFKASWVREKTLEFSYLCECSRLCRERDRDRERCRRRLSRSLERERERRFSRDAERERRRLRSRSRSRERDLQTERDTLTTGSCIRLDTCPILQ